MGEDPELIKRKKDFEVGYLASGHTVPFFVVAVVAFLLLRCRDDPEIQLLDNVILLGKRCSVV